MSKKIIDKEKTIQNIVEKVGVNIFNIENLTNADDEFLVEAAMLWEAEVVYK
jgi:hypothetical protein